MGRAWAGHPDSEITGGAGLQKKLFRPLGPLFSLKIGGTGPPGPSPRSATVLESVN